MSLKRRIVVANLLMVLIPVAATGLVALACVFALWHALSLGNGFDSTSDLRQAALAASAAADRALSARGDERTARLQDLDALLGKTGLSAELLDERSGEVVHAYGTLTSDDARLLATVAPLGDATLERDGRAVSSTAIESSGHAYRLALLGDIRASAHYTQLKAFAVAAAALLVLTVLGSSLLASRVIARVLVDRFSSELARAQAGLKRANDELAEANASLEAANERLRHRDRARRQLLADISHDLRSPLTSVRGYAEGLLDGIATTPERERHYLEVIRDKSRQVTDLVERVFEFSKLELDDYPVTVEPVEPEAFLARACADFVAAHEGLVTCELRATAKGSDSCPPPSMPSGAPLVLADRQLLGRCIDNMLGNSVKYREGPVAHVRLSWHVTGGRLLLELADNGRGLERPEDAERIFDPFFRTDAARERPQDGSGLGLAFVRRALELMGGTVSARALEPHGLAVTLDLPAANRTIYDAGGGSPAS